MLEIVCRDAWRAVPATWLHPCTQPRGHVVYMCFGKEFQRTRKDAKSFIWWMQHYSIWHLEYHDIRYNFMIGEDGTIYEGRGWTQLSFLPEKLKHLDKSALVLGIVGPLKAKDLPDPIVHAMDKLVEYGVRNGYVQDKVRFHMIEKNKEKDSALLELDLPEF